VQELEGDRIVRDERSLKMMKKSKREDEQGTAAKSELYRELWVLEKTEWHKKMRRR